MRLQRLKKYALAAGGMLVLATMLLLATGRTSAVAAQISSVFVTNTASNPVPVTETSTDASGNIKVHEQGTASVNVTNSTLPVHEQGTASTSSADQTTLLDSFAGSVDPGFTEYNVDISSARTVRVMTNCFVAACSNILVRIYVTVDGRSYLNDEYSMTGALLAQTHVYDVLGQNLSVQFDNQNVGAVDNVGLAVFGRSN